jgi:hypothetical protein
VQHRLTEPLCSVKRCLVCKKLAFNEQAQSPCCDKQFSVYPLRLYHHENHN